MNNLKDHIDDPIKKCVVGLNLLGIKTAMSCCGFTYKGELVPKKHLEKTYIYIDLLNTPQNRMETLILLARKSTWTMAFFGEAHPFCDFYAPAWEKGHPWNDENCPHFYEKAALGIHGLEEAIKSLRDYFLDEAIISDGNKMYTDTFKIKYWQYEPTEDWVVTKETFDSL